MNNVSLAKSLLEADDWQPLIDHLADDVVFKATIPDGTPISGERRGKEAVVDHLTNLGKVLVFRPEQPQEYFGGGDRVVVLGTESIEIKKSGVTVPTASTRPSWSSGTVSSPAFSSSRT